MSPLASKTPEFVISLQKRLVALFNWWWFRPIFLIVLLAAGIVATEKQILPGKHAWGCWKRTPPPKELHAQPGKWDNQPALKEMSPSDRANVLMKLLEQNREEVRFVQGLLFTTSFWFTVGIFGIVSFNLGIKGYHPFMRGASVAGCLLLCGFYFVFADFAEGAMVTSHDDMVGMQYGLELSKPNSYLLNDQVIYHAGDFGSESHIKALVQFYVLLVFVAVAVLLYLPGLPKDEKTADGGTNGDSPDSAQKTMT